MDALAVSRDGKRLFAATNPYNGLIKQRQDSRPTLVTLAMWDTQEWKPLRTVTDRDIFNISLLDPGDTSDQVYVVTGESSLGIYSRTFSQVVRWNLRDGRRTWFRGQVADLGDRIGSYELTTDGRLLVAGRQLFQASEAGTRADWPIAIEQVSTDGLIGKVHRDDGTMLVDLATGRMLPFPSRPPGVTRAEAGSPGYSNFSPNFRRVAYRIGNRLEFWDAIQHRKLSECEVSDLGTNILSAWEGEVRYLVSDGSKTFVVIDPETGDRIARWSPLAVSGMEGVARPGRVFDQSLRKAAFWDANQVLQENIPTTFIDLRTRDSSFAVLPRPLAAFSSLDEFVYLRPETGQKDTPVYSLVEKRIVGKVPTTQGIISASGKWMFHSERRSPWDKLYAFPSGHEVASIPSFGHVTLLPNDLGLLHRGDDAHYANFQRFDDLDQLTRLYAAAKKAVVTLQRIPDDAASLAMLCEWYALKRQWVWAADLLEKAREAGAPVSSLLLARCLSMHSDRDSRQRARELFNDAIARQEAPLEYLQRCRDSLAVDRRSASRFQNGTMMELAIARDADRLVGGDYLQLFDLRHTCSGVFWYLTPNNLNQMTKNVCLSEAGQTLTTASGVFTGCAAISSDGRFLAGGTHNARGFLATPLALRSSQFVIELYDSQTSRFECGFVGHKNRINSLQFSPDDHTLISASDDGTVRIWNGQTRTPAVSNSGLRGLMRLAKALGSPIDLVETGKQQLVFHSHKGPVKLARFSPDGRLVASLGRDGVLLAWHATTAEIVSRIELDDKISALAWVPGTTELLIGAGRDVVRVDALRGTEIERYRGCQRPVQEITVSHDAVLVAAAYRGGIWCWNTDRPNQGREYKSAFTNGMQLAFDRHGELWSVGEDALEQWFVHDDREAARKLAKAGAQLVLSTLEKRLTIEPDGVMPDCPLRIEAIDFRRLSDLTDAEFAMLSFGSASQLDVSGTQLTDASLDVIHSLSSLKILRTVGSGFTQTGLMTLIEGRDGSLEIDGVPVQEAILARNLLASGAKLEIRKRGSAVNNPVQNLDELPEEPFYILSADLRGMVGDSGLVHEKLSRLVHLRVLDLRGTNVGDYELSIIAKLPSLRTLRLDSKEVTSNGITHFNKAKRLVTIEGEVPNVDQALLKPGNETDTNTLTGAVAVNLILADRAEIAGDDVFAASLRSEAEALLGHPLDGRRAQNALIRAQQWEAALETFPPNGPVEWRQLFCWYALGDINSYKEGRRKLLAAQSEFDASSWNHEMILRASLLLPIEEAPEQRAVVRKLAEMYTNPMIAESWKRELVGQVMFRLGEFEAWWSQLSPESHLRNGEYNTLFLAMAQLEEESSANNLDSLKQTLQRIERRNAQQIDDLGVIQTYWWEWILSGAYVRSAQEALESNNRPRK